MDLVYVLINFIIIKMSFWVWILMIAAQLSADSFTTQLQNQFTNIFYESDIYVEFFIIKF